MALLTLRDEYPDVGVVDPSYHDFAAMTQKLSVAKRLGAAIPKYDRVIGIFNVGAHWIAFLIEKNANICHMFDPLQSERNCSAIERSVRKVMETVLGLEGKLDYKKIDWCKQQDGSSCGIWCIAVLEMLLAGFVERQNLQVAAVFAYALPLQGDQPADEACRWRVVVTSSADECQRDIRVAY
ncbi:unnamed protein product [Phytophthora fragariaefolia]|uniref:Unnamed protein product n=1 Tax=Phytophthora fragariaefolia TaxID=1490495 RepID=A0A9W7D1B9_9STRA|nr:unnamed protein product [Phytophthora fragariaefolia]